MCQLIVGTGLVGRRKILYDNCLGCELNQLFDISKWSEFSIVEWLYDRDGQNESF